MRHWAVHWRAVLAGIGVDKPSDSSYTARTRGGGLVRLARNQNCSGHDPGPQAPILWNSTASFPGRWERMRLSRFVDARGVDEDEI